MAEVIDAERVGKQSGFGADMMISIFLTVSLHSRSSTALGTAVEFSKNFTFFLLGHEWPWCFKVRLS